MASPRSLKYWQTVTKMDAMDLKNWIENAVLPNLELYLAWWKLIGPKTNVSPLRNLVKSVGRVNKGLGDKDATTLAAEVPTPATIWAHAAYKVLQLLDEQHPNALSAGWNKRMDSALDFLSFLNKTLREQGPLRAQVRKAENVAENFINRTGFSLKPTEEAEETDTPELEDPALPLLSQAISRMKNASFQSPTPGTDTSPTIEIIYRGDSAGMEIESDSNAIMLLSEFLDHVQFNFDLDQRGEAVRALRFASSRKLVDAILDLPLSMPESEPEVWEWDWSNFLEENRGPSGVTIVTVWTEKLEQNNTPELGYPKEGISRVERH
ncbi:hypothetical protein M011DRAFT_513832 [Sporormia fimetaria CBS 119925]|uniref:Uncharacterized protein n=1 Tax=Sporormia fimetaria CBS 119925 TaxID=1340428 RepID=A0A6A6UU83_9PLEO|nr:hypothetical protein M011DRAFT_513832 [Sporormia fimetaria CBS 119925]